METRRLTLVFTDVEGSSGLLERLRGEYPLLLAAHRRLVRAAAGAGAEEVECRGDGFIFAFENADEAAAFAVRVQQAHAEASWPGDERVRVRIGIHTGEALVGKEGYVGIDVHRAARIGAAAHGGQVLLSLQAAEQAAGVESRRLGDFRLAGLSEPQCLYQLVAPGLDGEYPPPRGVTPANRRRILVADDSVLLREGLVLLVERAGWDVVGQAADADELLAQVEELRPDVVIVDIRMPPTHTDDGLRAAKEIRRRHPELGVLVLSQYAEPVYARELLAGGEEGVGYLLKDRVADVDGFAATLESLAAGGCVLDPELRRVSGA
ncbi:MAG TPA: response regulator [Gaiellaceae bacterium]|nr:response regulator [Gaiellaceae bacterium]